MSARSTKIQGRSRLAYWAICVALETLFASASRVAVAHPHEVALGKVDFPITCSSEAQRHFDRGLALLHHMTYPQARASFQQAAATDERCAMAHWGIAMTLFQPLWPTRPGPADLQLGWDELQKAKALNPNERERMFIDAAEAFFQDPSATDYWLRIRRWEAASRRVHAALKDDPEAALFYALALLATTPANAATRAHADAAAAILLQVHERNREHPGAMHYLVHANDVPGRERDLIEVTRRYEQIAPNNPHALHMPTHIYTRLGEWSAVIKGNLRAADAALAHPAGERGDLVWDEFAHAIEYLVYAYLQQGADQAAARQVDRLQHTQRLEPTFKTAFHLASTRSRYVLERRAWEEAANIVPRSRADIDWDRFPWPEATAHFARGLGAAHLRKDEDAARALHDVQALERKTQAAGEELFARSIGVLRLELAAWIAHTSGSRELSVSLMGEAVQLESATPKHAVTPGPTLPALELLGDMLMQQGRPADALDAYKEALARYPNRFNSLLGAARAARSINDRVASAGFYEQLLQIAARTDRTEIIAEADDYLVERH